MFIKCFVSVGLAFCFMLTSSCEKSDVQSKVSEVKKQKAKDDRSTEVDLIEGNWTPVNGIYVNFVGAKSEDGKTLWFISAEKPHSKEESNWMSSDKKYSLSRKAIGEAGTLGKRVIKYDAFGKPSQIEEQIFLSYKIISYDQSQKRVKIKILNSAEESSKDSVDTTQAQDKTLTEITVYDEYEREKSTILKNVKGEVVATKTYYYNKYDGTLFSEDKIDPHSNEIIHKTIYAFGSPKNPMFLCFDKDGNIVKSFMGKPLLVGPFMAVQKETGKHEYDGSFRTRTVTNYYPCKNCAEKTNNNKVTYVW